MLTQWARSSHRSRIGRWLLPCLLARVLVPLGFMPGNLLAGEFVVPCPSAMPASVFADNAHAHHGHAAHHGGSHDNTHGDNSPDLTSAERQCPIGLALSASLHSAPEAVTLELPRAATGPAMRCVPAVSNTPNKHYLSRAPPTA